MNTRQSLAGNNHSDVFLGSIRRQEFQQQPTYIQSLPQRPGATRLLAKNADKYTASNTDARHKFSLFI
jgi:hypothetical protein